MGSTLASSPRKKGNGGGSAEEGSPGYEKTGLRRRPAAAAPPEAAGKWRAPRAASRAPLGLSAAAGSNTAGAAASTEAPGETEPADVDREGVDREEIAAPPVVSTGMRSLLPLLAVVVLVIVVIAMALGGAGGGGTSQPVRVVVQLSQVEGQHSLPEGESPESLVRFLGRKAGRLAFELPGSSDAGGSTGSLAGAKLVYISIASFNRLDEMVVDRRQVTVAGQVDAFLFVWMTSPDQCREGDVTGDHREYVHDRLGFKVPVGFICYWDGFFDAKLTSESLASLDRALATNA